jgi:NAD(P)-dependent dehydrogenase (short-subunit alcohol dehydrogenase family)
MGTAAAMIASSTAMSPPEDLYSVNGRVAVITGASTGLGARFASCLAARGARVVLAARRTQRIEKLAEELRDQSAEAIAVTCDVSLEVDVERLVQTAIDTFGKLDLLINNAGLWVGGFAQEEDLGGFRQVLEVNLTGTFLCSQRAGRVMLRQGKGVIINVASIWGLGSASEPTGGSVSYAASKAGVINLTRELAVQWGRSGIRVNAIAPGFFPTEINVDLFSSEERLAGIRQRTAMGRTGRQEELDGVLLFLASDASSYVTGQTIFVDGGWSAY